MRCDCEVNTPNTNRMYCTFDKEKRDLMTTRVANFLTTDLNINIVTWIRHTLIDLQLTIQFQSSNGLDDINPPDIITVRQKSPIWHVTIVNLETPCCKSASGKTPPRTQYTLQKRSHWITNPSDVHAHRTKCQLILVSHLLSILQTVDRRCWLLTLHVCRDCSTC